MTNDRQWIQLCAAACDETLTQEQLVELENRLRSDPEARPSFLRVSQLHSLLELAPPTANEIEIEDSLAESKIVRLTRKVAVAWVAAAAMIAVAFTMGLQFFAGNPPKAIATLILAEDCEWGGHSYELAEGQRLVPGSLKLEKGMAIVRFDGGAELVLHPMTEVNLRTEGSAELHRGEVTVRAEDGAEGFTLETPASQLVDLGTEFGVKVNASGATELHVLEGRVAAGQEVVDAGKALRFDRKGGKPREVALNSRRFDEVVRQVKPRTRADLMTAYAGFHYPEGELALTESTAGKGWAGPWRHRSPGERRLPEAENTPDFLKIVHGEMNVTWPVPGGRLGMLEMPAGGAFYVRDLVKPIDMSQSGVIYFSLMVRETERLEASSRPLEGMRLTFRSSAEYFGPSLSFGHGRQYRPRVQIGQGVGFVSPMLSPAEQTSLWVGKAVMRKHGNDEIHFRIYGEHDQLHYAEPAVWHVVARDVDLSAKFDRVLLSSTGSTARIVDELRIGPTWRSVVPFKSNELQSY